MARRGGWAACVVVAVGWAASALVAACGCPPLGPPYTCAGVVRDHTSAPGGSCGNGVIDVGEECDGDMCCDPWTCTQMLGCAWHDGPTIHLCGNGKVEAHEQCDEGKNNGMPSNPCKADCTLDPNNPCGNGKLDVPEECDLGSGNSCAEGTVSPCTCTCKNKKCGDGVVQADECCDDAWGGGGGQVSHCTADCKGCENPGDPACKCGVAQVASSTSILPSCKKRFKAVVSSQANPAMPGAGLPSSWASQGFVGLKAGNALCQAIGGDHVCTFAEVVAADSNGELAAIPTNLTYWLHRTTNVPDYLQDNGAKACSVAADCGGADVCDPKTKLCSWKPGAGGRCNDWTTPSDALSDGEWFRTLPEASGGGVAKGSLSFHFAKSTNYDGMTKPACQDEASVGCAGPCATPQRAILCCLPSCQ